MGRSRSKKNRKEKKGDGVKRSQNESSRNVINSDLHGKEHELGNFGSVTHGNIDSSGTSSSQRRKENSTTEKESKYLSDAKDDGTKGPQHGLSSIEMNDNLHEDKSRYAGAVADKNIGHNTYISQRKKDISNNEKPSKYQCDIKGNASKGRWNEVSTCKMNVDLHDEEENKLDYAGCVTDNSIDWVNTSSSQRKKDNSTFETVSNCQYDKKDDWAKGHHCGSSTSKMDVNLHASNIKGSKSKSIQQPNRKEFKKSVVREVKGDLFSAPTEYSLAHCVAADMRMGSGIATTFRQNFKQVDQLLAQKKRPGDVAVLNIEEQNRFIYYLVTKTVSNGKPYKEDLHRSLQKMKEHILENNVHKLAMPRIGCGLDRLEWSEVLPMIENMFCDTEIDIVVYDFSKITEDKPKISKNVYIRHKSMNLVDIQPDTAYIFIGSEDGFVDSTIESLDRKFHIIQDYKKAIKKLGEVIKISRRDYFYGLIARERHSISYKDLGRCLQKLRKMLLTDNYVYVGFEALFDSDDIIATHKVTTVIGNYLDNKFEVWVCWPDSVIQKISSSFLPNFQ